MATMDTADRHTHVATPATALGNRIIKVNHAGEHGAICIYSAQILCARIWNARLAAELCEFREHERRHRALFAAELERRQHPRCRSYWLCALGGAVLGAVTGILGPSAIAATTVAIEAVVLRHLSHQIDVLLPIDPAAAQVVQAIVDDERAHHDHFARDHAGGFWERLLTPIVSTATEAVIWLGMRL